MALYQEIVADIRQKIMNGTLEVGDGLPSVRGMARRWQCAPGTVQRAYQELALQGLVTAKVGQGTQVAALAIEQTTVRRATLVNRVETLLLEMMAAGYSPEEVEDAVRKVMIRWRERYPEIAQSSRQLLRFVGDHDPVIGLLENRFSELAPDYDLSVTFVSGTGGLLALARQGADVAGIRLWDRETGRYNIPFVHRMLPGRRVAMLTVAHRRLGLIVRPGNPHTITSLADLHRPDVRVIHRQPGAGSRIWLETRCQELGLDPGAIHTLDWEAATHLEVAGAVARGEADAGLAVEAAALAQNLDFVLQTTERYDLVVPREIWELSPIQHLAAWLASDAARQAISDLGGYDVAETGRVKWVE